MFVRGSPQRHQGLLWHTNSLSLEQLAAKMVAMRVVAVSMVATLEVSMVAAAALLAQRCDKSTPCFELQSVGAGLP